MIKVSRLSDYGIVIASHLAREAGRQLTAGEIAAGTQIPQPTVSKIMKTLGRAGLVVSHRGAHGGYSLARPATAVSVAAVVEALDGPIALTSCLGEHPHGGRHECGLASRCPTRANWRRINDAIREALDGVTIDEMATTRRPTGRSSGREPDAALDARA